MTEINELPRFLAIWPLRKPRLTKLLKRFGIILPLVLCGCQSQLPVVAQCPTIPPLPAGIQKQEPTLTQELVKLLSPSQKEATKQSTN